MRVKFLFFLLTILVIISFSTTLSAENVSFSTSITKLENHYLVQLTADILEGFHLYAPGEVNGIPVKFEFPTNPLFTVGVVTYAKPIQKEYEQLGGILQLYEGKSQFSFAITPLQKEMKYAFGFSYQACTDTQCFMPETKSFAIDLSTAVNGVVSPPLQNTTIVEPPKNKPVDSGKMGNQSPDQSESTFTKAYRESGLIYVILLAFALGLISSLTPCVYPMIPITVAFFGSQNEEGVQTSKLRKFFHSLIFAVGIGLSFAILGGIFTWVGKDLGTIFANVWAASFISLILILFALASFEYFEIKPPAFLLNKLGGTSQKGALGSLIMGLTLGLVAAPCVGPFAGSLLLFVASLGQVMLGFILLFVYGLGLGSLFMVVALGVTFLPKAGMWMVHLKKIFGVVILFTSVYIMQFVLPLWGLALFAGFLGIFSAVVLDIFQPMATTESFLAVITRSFAIFCLILGIVLTGWAVLQLLPGQPSASMVEDTHSSLNWVKDHDQALAQAKQLGKPVFMDFYADWCIPCREMDKIFANAEVQKELERFVIAKLDCTQSTNSAAIIKRDKYNAPYMPFLLFFDRQGNRLREQEFHGYTDLQTFLAALRSIK